MCDRVCIFHEQQQQQQQRIITERCGSAVNEFHWRTPTTPTATTAPIATTTTTATTGGESMAIILSRKRLTVRDSHGLAPVVCVWL